MNGFDDLMILLRLVTDPEAMKARLAELQSAIDASDAKAAEAHAAQAKLDTERTRLAKLDASLREREVIVFESERKHERELDELRKWKREHAQSRLVKVGFGDLTREPDLSEPGRDPINDPMAEEMDLAPAPPSRPVQTHRPRSLHR